MYERLRWSVMRSSRSAENPACFGANSMVTSLPGLASCCASGGGAASAPAGPNSVSDPALCYGGVVARFFRAAENLAIEADALEPEVQAEQIGEAHAAMHLGRRPRDMAAD